MLRSIQQKGRRLPAICGVLGITGALLGCGASVSVHGGVISGDGPYRSVWKRSWERIYADQAPYIATATSPGVCNAGGDKRGCWAADFRTSADFRALRAGLTHVHVPGPYKRANSLTLQAIAHGLRGLRLRMTSLQAGPWTMAQRNAWFQESNREIRAGELLFAQAYAAFPAWARPSPAPRF